MLKQNKKKKKIRNPKEKKQHISFKEYINLIRKNFKKFSLKYKKLKNKYRKKRLKRYRKATDYLLKKENQFFKKLRLKKEEIDKKNPKYISKAINKIGKTELEVTGLNITRLINHLISNNIKVYKCVATENGVKILIKATQLRTTKLILNEQGYKYKQQSKSKLQKILLHLTKRQGITIVILIFFIMYGVFANFVMKIEVSSHQKEVTKILQEANIDRMTPLSSINTKDLEKLILSKMNNISFCDIRIKGTTLLINLTEGLTNEDISGSIKNHKIIANCDAVISRQLIYNGTPLKKMGDVVKKGEVLIENYIMIDEETEFESTAEGKVYGYVWYKKTKFIPKTETKMVRTGRKKTKTNFAIFKEPKMPNSPYDNYEQEISKQTLNNILPLRYFSVTFYETKNKIFKNDKNKINNYYLKNLTYEVVKNIGVEDKFNRTWHTLEDLGTSYKLTVYAESEKLISEKLFIE